MSTSRSDSNNLDAVKQKAMAELFGAVIKSARERIGYSIEKASGLAGIEAREWSSMEAGKAPDLQKLDAIGAAVKISKEQMSTSVLLFRDSWVTQQAGD